MERITKHSMEMVELNLSNTLPMQMHIKNLTTVLTKSFKAPRLLKLDLSFVLDDGKTYEDTGSKEVWFVSADRTGQYSTLVHQ